MIKKPLLLTMTFTMFAFCPLVRAQDQEPNIDSIIQAVRTSMQADRDTLVTASMNLSNKDSAVFWPIYRQFQYERSKVDDRRVAVIKEYTQKYPNLTDAEAKAMAEQMLQYDSELVALKKKYFKKFSKALPALTVTAFFQLDRRIDLMMDMQVEASLPPLARPQVTPLAIDEAGSPEQ